MLVDVLGNVLLTLLALVPKAVVMVERNAGNEMLLLMQLEVESCNQLYMCKYSGQFPQKVSNVEEVKRGRHKHLDNSHRDRRRILEDKCLTDISKTKSH